MYTLNQLTIIGFTGNDAEAHYTPNGTLIVSQHHIAATVPSLIQLAEAAVAIAAWLCFAILLPEQLQR